MEDQRPINLKRYFETKLKDLGKDADHTLWKDIMADFEYKEQEGKRKAYRDALRRLLGEYPELNRRQEKAIVKEQ